MGARDRTESYRRLAAYYDRLMSHVDYGAWVSYALNGWSWRRRRKNRERAGSRPSSWTWPAAPAPLPWNWHGGASG